VLLELTVAEQRVNAVMEVLRDGLTVTEVADRYGVSRQAVHSWLGRYRSGGLDALADRSHRPHRCPHQMPAEVEGRLAHELARDGVDPPPGLTSIYRAWSATASSSPGPANALRPATGAGARPADGAVAAGHHGCSIRRRG
jgi:hypothetical protein